MDYKEKYERSIEKAQKMQENSNGMILKKWLWAVFPELAESEDERIRKGLIKAVSGILKGNTLYGTDVTREEALAWLEKQGELKKVKFKFNVDDWIVTDDSFGKIVRHVDEISDNIIDKRYVVSDENGLIYNISFDKEHKWHKWTIKDAEDGDVLVEDSCIFIIQKLGDNNTAAKTYCTLYNDGDFDDGSILYFDIDSTKPATKEQRDMLFHKMKEKGYEWNSEKKELKTIEQKSADKTEPKFKVGNWYQCTKDFFGKGVTFDKGTAYYCAKEGCLLDGCHIAIVKDLYNNFKLWTIEDAKDGDVLAVNWHEGDDYWEKIIIFKKYYNKGVKGLYSMPCVEGYGNTFKNGKMAFQEEIPYYSKTWTANLHPSTEEQRYLLFQKMKEAGYEWDSEKKELKRIKQKSVDKVETKFHEGDFIKHDKSNIIYKVISVDNVSYYVENIETSGRIDIFNAEQNFHLWTINDAKDGDVLVSGDVIFIFNNIHGVWVNCHCSWRKYCSFKDRNYDLTYTENSKEVYPATKEQRDLLFQKMKEVGYEWDSEKKELKKIEPKILGADDILPYLGNNQVQDILEDMGMLDDNGRCPHTAEEIFKAGMEHAFNLNREAASSVKFDAKNR